MPPRKKAATAPTTPKAANSDVPHADDCMNPRMESFTALRPDGSEASVTRCQECGGQTTK